MALQVSEITRQFTIEKGGKGKDITLTDPNPELSPEEVMKFYATTYPELTNGMVEGPKVVGGNASYSITTKAGKLG